MPQQQREAPVLFRYIHRFNVLMGQDFPPGPRTMPWYLVINLQKGGCLPFCLALMWYYDNWSPACWCYTAAHGSYGLCWLLKHCLFPDPQWSTPVTLVGSINSFLFVLGPYWLAPFLLISRAAPMEPSVARCAAAVVVYVLGVVLMMSSDCYKSATLMHRPGLITSGPFALCRHPNYLGEMMIYGAFAAMVPHWAPKAVLAWVWGMVFATNICMKEARMSRHPGWDDYCVRTGLLLPKPATLVRVAFAGGPGGEAAKAS